jgi:hypothetical protein
MPKIRYKYYVRCYQLVTKDGEDAPNLINSCLNNNIVLSFFYFPIVVFHNLYENANVLRICEIYTPQQVGNDERLFLKANNPSVKLIDLFCYKINFYIRRLNPNGQIINRRVIRRKAQNNQ